MTIKKGEMCIKMIENLLITQEKIIQNLINVKNDQNVGIIMEN